METTKSGLNRALGLSTAVLLVISSMIGSGIFKKIAPMSAVLGDGNLILFAWLIAGLISLFGVFSYAGLATLTEEGGGQFEYFRIIYGKFFAFLFGWACFTVIQTASIASIAYVFAESVNNLAGFGDPIGQLMVGDKQLKELNIGGAIFPFANSGVKLFTILTIVVLTVINYYGVKKGGLLNDLFSSAKIAGIILLIVAGFLLHDHTTPSVDQPVVSDRELSLVSAMFVAMLSAFWAYDGWINVSYIGGEIKNPKRNIPIAFIAGTAVVMLLYLLVNYTYLLALPVGEYQLINQQGNKIAGAEMARSIMGYPGFVVLSVLIMLCTFGSTNASLMSSPRIYHRMAQQGLFFRSFGKTHTKYHTPHVSLVYQAAWASVLVISGTFDQLTNMLIFASFIAYGAGAAGLIYMKSVGKKNKEGVRIKINARVFGYPFIPVIFILFCIGLIINTILTMPDETRMGLFFILLGIPVYYLVNAIGKK